MKNVKEPFKIALIYFIIGSVWILLSDRVLLVFLSQKEISEYQNLQTIKGFFFGGAMAVISCYKGFNCKEGARGVGQACTEAFVMSFISILALDFVLVVVFKALYSSFWPLKSLV